MTSTAVRTRRTFYEFFAGGGMAQAGLGTGWRCLLANDFDPMKAATYEQNWGSDHLRVQDVATLSTWDLPDSASLAWASFPCQDLSLAGSGAGLGGERSGTFWPFWKLIRQLRAEERAPRVVILENVYGTITSHGGRDLVAICEAVAEAGYLFGAVVIDAALFLPQSRPRLFIACVRDDSAIPAKLRGGEPMAHWHPAALRSAMTQLSAAARERLVWWQLPAPPKRSVQLADLIEDEPTGVEWNSPEKTQQILDMMAEVHREKVAEAKRLARASGVRVIGTIYRRTRLDEDGEKRQRAEVRFDETAGCLRTPGGGSSRQTLIVVEPRRIRTRLLSPREAARLMGLPDSYKLPSRYNDAYHVAGDGVAVPVVRFIAKALAEPILKANGE